MSDEIHKHIIKSGNETYCGETIFEWAFTCFEHWYLNWIHKDRLLGCRKCLKEIEKQVKGELNLK